MDTAAGSSLTSNDLSHDWALDGSVWVPDSERDFIFTSNFRRILTHSDVTLHNTRAFRRNPAGPRRISSSFAWSLSGNLVAGSTQFVQLILIAKLMSTRSLGEFALATAVVTPTIAFCNLQLRSIQAGDAEHRYSLFSCVGLRLITCAIACVLAWIVGLSTQTDTVTHVIMALAIWKAVGSLADVLYGTIQRTERMELIATSQTLSSLGQLLAFGGTLFLSRSLVAACLAAAATAATVVLGYDLPNARRSTNGHSSRTGVWRELPRLAWTALPLGFVTGIVTLTGHVPRFLLDRWHELELVGIFAALAAPGLVLQQSAMALSQAMLPRFGQLFANEKGAAFRSLIGKAMAINLTLGLIAVGLVATVGKPLLGLMYREDLQHYHLCFVWVTLAYAIHCTGAVGGVLTAARRYQVQLWISILTGSVMFASGLILIPEFGVFGAAYAGITASSVRLIAISTIVHFITRDMKPISPAREDLAHPTVSLTVRPASVAASLPHKQVNEFKFRNGDKVVANVRSTE